MWVPSACHTEGLLQVALDKGLVVSRWQPGWEVDAGQHGSGGGPEPKQLSFVGKGGWVAVARVIGSHTVPAIATGQEAIEAPESTGLQCLAQPQRALHQCTGCCSIQYRPVELLLGA